MWGDIFNFTRLASWARFFVPGSRGKFLMALNTIKEIATSLTALAMTSVFSPSAEKICGGFVFADNLDDI